MTDPAGTGPARTDAPSPRARPPLRRDTEAGLVGGVAAGLARHLDIDVVLVRIGFVVGTILTQGLGIIAYVLCWIFVPNAEEGTQAPRPATSASSEGRGAPFWVGVGLVTLGALWFLGAMPWPVLFGFGWLDGGVLVPLLLIGLGVALWHSSGRQPVGPARPPVPSSDQPPPSSPPPPPNPSASTTEQIMPSPTQTTPDTEQAAYYPPPSFDPELADDVADDQGTARIDRPTDDEGYQPPPPPPPTSNEEGDGFVPPPVPTRSRSLLTRATLGLTLVTVGVLWVLEVTTTLSLGPLRILAIALAVIAAGLLLGSWVGRARLLIIPGLLLLPLIIAGVMVRGLPAGDFVDRAFVGDAAIGEIVHMVSDVDDLEPRYRLGAGSFRLDLSALELEEDVSTLIEFGAGEVVVIVPDDVNVEVYGSLVGGEIILFDQRHAGVTFERRLTEPALVDPDDAQTLDLRINGGFGDLTVRR